MFSWIMERMINIDSWETMILVCGMAMGSLLTGLARDIAEGWGANVQDNAELATHISIFALFLYCFFNQFY